MTTDVAVIQSDMSALDAMEPHARELALTAVLEQSKEWLMRASMATDPARAVADFKAFITTIAEATKQKKVSEEIQQEAQVMVRRSERALGVAIREGQGRGDIGKPGDNTRTDLDSSLIKVSPRDYINSGTETVHTYAMTDNVSDEQFEEALTEASQEGNVSRANVVRKIRNEDSPRKNSSRREHLLVLQKVSASISTYAEVVAEILNEGLDDSVTTEEAATLHDDLSKALHTINRIKRELNARKAL